MKIKSLIALSACASALLANSACSPSMGEKQLKYTHTTLVDNDAYQAFKAIGGKIPYEISYAEYIERTSSSAEEKALAKSVLDTYKGMLPTLDSLATRYHVDFPILGAQKFQADTLVHQEEESAAFSSAAVAENVNHALADSTQALTVHNASHTEATHAATTHHDEDYIHHVQHTAALIKDQLYRMSRNTNKDIVKYAKSNEEAVGHLFEAAGGKEDAHAHH